MFGIALFGTLIETGTGMIHAVNEGIALDSRNRPGTSLNVRSLTAIGFLDAAASTSRAGLIDLIARGYDSMAWVVSCSFVIPVLTYGVWQATKGHVWIARRRVKYPADLPNGGGLFMPRVTIIGGNRLLKS